MRELERVVAAQKSVMANAKASEQRTRGSNTVPETPSPRGRRQTMRPVNFIEARAPLVRWGSAITREARAPRVQLARASWVK